MIRDISLAICLGLIGLASCSQAVTDPVETEASAMFESPYFSVTVSGSGPDVILLPGLASSGTVWDDTVAALQDRYTLHVIQVSGFAGAPANGNVENENILDDLADGLAAYSQEMDAPPALVGHSLGGLVAMKTALHADATLNQLVIIDVLPFFSVLMDPGATSQSIAPISAMMKAAMLGQPDEIFAQSQGEALKALVKSDGDLQRALSWSVDSDRAVMAQAMSEVLITDLWSQVSEIATPTLVLYAKDDATPNMAAIEAFYETLYAPMPNLSLIAISDAFHFIMLDQPDAFISAIESALID